MRGLVGESLRPLEPERLVLDLMDTPRWRLDEDLAARRWSGAAAKIMLRMRGFARASPLRVLGPHEPDTANSEFFDREGCALLQDVLAFVLMLLDATEPARPPALRHASAPPHTTPLHRRPAIMDDDAVALPIVFTSPGTSRLETTLAAVAIEKAAEAYDWARRGDAAHDTARWVRTVRAAVLASPGAEAALRAEGVPAPAARALVACMPLGADTPAQQWLGIAGAAGVPDRERPVLGALGPLALGAANLLPPPDEPDRLIVAPLVNPVPDPADECRSACILATRLDAPGVLERELLDVLGVSTHALIDSHAGFNDWISRPGDPTVRVRVPPEHRGLPLAFCPLVATQPAALAALEEGALLDEVLEPVAEAFNEFLDDQRRTPQ